MSRTTNTTSWRTTSSSTSARPTSSSLQEIQDDNGTGTGVLSANQNLAPTCVDALNAADPTAHYVYADIDPTAENSTGGEPNGNIRNAFVYDINRVSLVARQPAADPRGRRLPQQPQSAGRHVQLQRPRRHRRRRPFLFARRQRPRFRRQPAAGRVRRRPPHRHGRRRSRAYVDDHLATDPSLQFAVMGDFNGFYYETALQHLAAGGVLTNLNGLLAARGALFLPVRRQSPAVRQHAGDRRAVGGAQYDSVHINAEFSAATRPTDHDPQVAALLPAGAQPGADRPRARPPGGGREPAGGHDRRHALGAPTSRPTR